MRTEFAEFNEVSETGLVNCPFCRSMDLHPEERDRDLNDASEREEFSVRCNDCGAEGPTANNTVKAIILWNHWAE